jgi:hypothetical protein
MKVKLSQLYNMEPVLVKLSKTSMSGFNAFRVAKVLRAVREELSLSQEIRVGLIDKYAEKGADGKPIFQSNGGIQMNKDLQDLAEKDFGDFFNSECTLPDVTIEAALEFATLTPIEVESILPLLKDE